MDISQIDQRAWSYASVLQDAGLSFRKVDIDQLD